jgi:hypothetical protein
VREEISELKDTPKEQAWLWSSWWVFLLMLLFS